MDILKDRLEIVLCEKSRAVLDRRKPEQLEIVINESEIVTEDDLWSSLRSKGMSISAVTHVTGKGILAANLGGVTLESLQSVEWNLTVKSQTKKRGALRLVELTSVGGSLKVDGPVSIPNLRRVGKRCEIQNGASVDQLRSVGSEFVSGGVGTSAQRLVSVGGMAILEAGCAPSLRFVGGHTAKLISCPDTYQRNNLPFSHASCEEDFGSDAAERAGELWLITQALVTEVVDEAAGQFDEGTVSSIELV